ncbi:MAG: hypothetical protein J1D77_09185 [Muribaculaceae bacterium]|nr:hypothetical protein [Muribaculaceae bacterium]
MIFINRTKEIFPRAKMVMWIVVCSLFLLATSCFTGIEGTKKINLSREDRKLSNPSPEELFMKDLVAQPLKDWTNGKRFIAADDKALLVIVPQSGILPVAPDSVKGKVLEFIGVESKINAAGQINVGLQFTDHLYLYVYDTGKEFDYAMENLFSDQVPMLIDSDMVVQARNLLRGHKFWTRSPLWYDEEGNRIDGRKFVEVTVTDVEPGNLVFPLRLKILTPENQEVYMFMNYGNADNESRSFHNIFSLSDPRRHYPSIDDETWDHITRSRVKEGMTKEEVRLSLGNPSDSNTGHDYSQTLDIWSYENGRVLWFEDGRLVRIRQ